MMRITYFTDTYRIGGAERFFVNVIAGAADAGHEVTVVAPQSSVLEMVRAEIPAATRVLLRTDIWTRPSRTRRIGAFARALPEVPLALRRARPQLVHVNNGGYPGSDLCRAATIAARLVGAERCVLTVNGTPGTRPADRPQIQAFADRLVWRSVDAVHVGTAFVEQRLGELRGMPPGLGSYIPYGVEEPKGTSADAAAVRKRLAPRDALLVGMASATSEVEKGHAVLAEALAKAGVGVRAVVVGARPGKAVVQRLAAAGLADRVTITGRLAPEALGAHLRAIDVLIMPSIAYESLPLVILEAMAAGKAVFASRLAGVPEAVDDGVTGRLFEPGAADELAALLRHATVSREQVRQMGEIGRVQWRERFSTGAMTRSMLELYERLNVSTR